jgi:PAS domain S-box-containing protein
VDGVSPEPESFRDPFALRRLVEQLPAVTFELRRGGRPEDMYFTYVSPQVERITGYRADDVMGDVELFSRAVHPDDRPRVVAEVLRASGEIDRFDAEFRLVTPEGRVTWLHARASPASTEEGQLRWLGVALDVTEQKVAEDALRAAEERYRAVVQNTYDLVVIADPECRVVYASPSHRAVLGVDPAELVGRDALEWVGPADLDHSRTSFAEALEGIRSAPIRYSMRRRDGQQVILEGSGWQPVFDDVGEVKLVLGISRDVTARVRAERERAELYAKIVEAQGQERARIANDLHDDPVQGMTALGLQIATIAHGLEDDNAKRRLSELGEMVESTVARLRNLMFQLWPPALESGGLTAAVDEYLERELGPSISYEVRSSLDHEPPLPVRIVAYRVVQEALQNVRKHASATSVLVILATERNNLVVRVEDDGIGFAPPIDDGGPGHIGLRSMRERVELAGGTFHVGPRVPVGTEVGFRLPIS